MVSTPNGASSDAISSTLPGLWLAMTSRSPANGWSIASGKPERRSLASGEVPNALPREPQHVGEERLVERRAFGGRLDLDNARPFR